MARWLIAVVAASFIVAMAAGGAPAVETGTDEGRLADAAGRLDTQAGTAAPEVRDRLLSDFNATDGQIRSLREKKLGYGEIAIVFSLAGRDGAITDEGIARVLALRSGPPVMGWGLVAKRLGVRLGDAVRRVERTDDGASRDVEASRAAWDSGRSRDNSAAVERSGHGHGPETRAAAAAADESIHYGRGGAEKLHERGGRGRHGGR